MYADYLANEETKYFIIDTHGGRDPESDYDDKDFYRYAWELSHFGKVRENDLFIYRRPARDSEIKEFYFFGAGVFGEIKALNNEKSRPVYSNVQQTSKFTELINATRQELLDYQWEFKERKNNWGHFFNQYGMTEIKKKDFIFLYELGHAISRPNFLEGIDSLEQIGIAEDLESTYIDKEGKKIKTYGYKYERNGKLRKRALEIHGYSCKACGFNFTEKYGELGKKFIEVHHIKPLSENGGEAEVNPRTDLIPLCSNCHRMVHRKREKVLSIEDLKTIMQSI